MGGCTWLHTLESSTSLCLASAAQGSNSRTALGHTSSVSQALIAALCVMALPWIDPTLHDLRE